MLRGFAFYCAISLVSFARPASACKCISSLQPCNQTKSSDVVFIGTVESMEPMFLSRWNASSQSSMESLNEAYIDARRHPSDASLDRLKNAYRTAFPDVAADQRSRLETAKTAASVASLFYSGLGRGMHVRFKVKTLFKNEDDDDDAPAKESRKETEDTLEVWTPFGECGYDFQAGETYVVYANNDEGSSNSLSTDVCTRTRRLSEGGQDLAYLFFYKDQPASSRLEGFATTDELYRLTYDHLHDPQTMKSPVAGVVIELQSDRLTRFTETDGSGRFVFDGLPAGNYKLSAYAAGYPVNPALLAGPKAFPVEPKGCSLQVLLLPKERGIP
jgi:Carboxypeptidase regulatory-like domain